MTIRRSRNRFNCQLKFLQKTDGRNRASFGVPIACLGGILLGIRKDRYFNDRC